MGHHKARRAEFLFTELIRKAHGRIGTLDLSTNRFLNRFCRLRFLVFGTELQEFIDNTLFSTLNSLDVSDGNKRALIIREIFSGTNNYMKN